MPSGQRVYIGNIPSQARERDLEKFFKGYGRLREVIVKNGYGFVEFDDYRTSRRGLGGKVLGSNPMRVANVLGVQGVRSRISLRRKRSKFGRSLEVLNETSNLKVVGSNPVSG